MTINTGAGPSWKAGWREIAGRRIFFRSRWESNYGLYLQWLKEHGIIAEWEHEPETFWFEKIRRGVRSYLPDFRVTELNGSIAYHEVKGWMDPKSKTKIKRMAKYHAQVKLIVISKNVYRGIEAKVSGLVVGWERDEAAPSYPAPSSARLQRRIDQIMAVGPRGVG